MYHAANLHAVNSQHSGKDLLLQNLQAKASLYIIISVVSCEDAFLCYFILLGNGGLLYSEGSPYPFFPYKLSNRLVWRYQLMLKKSRGEKESAPQISWHWR